MNFFLYDTKSVPKNLIWLAWSGAVCSVICEHKEFLLLMEKQELIGIIVSAGTIKPLRCL